MKIDSLSVEECSQRPTDSSFWRCKVVLSGDCASNNSVVVENGDVQCFQVVYVRNLQMSGQKLLHYMLLYMTLNDLDSPFTGLQRNM